MCGVFEVLYTAPHTKTYYKCGFFNNIYFLFFRKIALPITLVIFMLPFVVFIVVMNRPGSMKRLIEKFGGSQITKSGSYNTNKSIIQIDILTQGHSSWGT